MSKTQQGGWAGNLAVPEIIDSCHAWKLRLLPSNSFGFGMVDFFLIDGCRLWVVSFGVMVGGDVVLSTGDLGPILWGVGLAISSRGVAIADCDARIRSWWSFFRSGSVRQI